LPQPGDPRGALPRGHLRAGLVAGEGPELAGAPVLRQPTELRGLLPGDAVVAVQGQIVAEHGDAQVQRAEPQGVVVGARREVLRVDAPQLDAVELAARGPAGDLLDGDQLMPEGDRAQRQLHRAAPEVRATGVAGAIASSHRPYTSCRRRLIRVSRASCSSSNSKSPSATRRSPVAASLIAWNCTSL